jgi:hypothetical protein
LRRRLPQGVSAIGVAGLDVVRNRDGDFVVPRGQPAHAEVARRLGLRSSRPLTSSCATAAERHVGAELTRLVEDGR